MLFLVSVIVTEAQRHIYPRKYCEYVQKYSIEFSVPEYIIYSVIKVESGFREDAISTAGACGLMQLMPSTYEWLTELLNEEPKDIFSPEENIKHGVYLLALLYERYDSWYLAYCAYNAGIGNVDKWLSEEKFEIKFQETLNYVNKIKVAEEKYLTLYYR
ncbi:MAG: lytic transglycosylase domain-containing protein [Clostridia bacterium]|nr:lytic transglycosylase domain-containing protein [Clostridia bacterium]